MWFWIPGEWTTTCFDTCKRVYIIIEANHDPDMLEMSSYPNGVKARILSHIGHLSSDRLAEALKRLIKGRGEHIYLTHLSNNNNLPALAEQL
ncbi:hypothetical protein P7H12_20160 [Paenibacillus larvae]|nr:hypothetical protein [Paenibacillus larvae]MDT2265430.1 hypothetical protein [Paenibacillus larvae]